MVFYGPWQEGRIHEEIIHGKTSVDVNPPVVYELLSPAPTRRSGFSISALPGTSVTTSASWEWLGGISNPPPPRADKSQEAFIAVLIEPTGATGGEYQFQFYSFGSRHQVSVGVWTASHGWSIQLMEYRMGYVHINDMGTQYAVPEGFDPMTSEYYTELEPWALGENARLELVSATVLGPGDLGDWGLFAKDVGEEHEFLTTMPMGVGPSQINMAPFDFDADELQAVMEYVQDNGTFPGTDQDAFAMYTLLPRMAWLYKGPVLSDPHFDASRFVTGTDGNPVDVKVTYKFPRWRQVFYENPRPYRRIRPRKDGRAGGAGRNGALSNARQSSRRTSGTYT